MAKIKPPAAGQFYHGVYPGGDDQCPDATLANLKKYECAVGKRVAFVTCIHDWSYGKTDFPWDTVNWILDHGAAPYLRLATWSVAKHYFAETKYTLKAIADGDFDAELTRWGREAAKSRIPLFCEWGTEANGYWFPWNAAHNGADAGPNYGAPLFRKAYQRIICTTRKAGADNISWVFHVNWDDNPKESWNRLEDYDPGCEFTDWIGISIYGSQSPDSQSQDWVDFASAMNGTAQKEGVYPRVCRLKGNRPIMVSEFGFANNSACPRQPAAWTQGTLTAILHNCWPRLAGFSWWNESWKQGNELVELHVQNSPGVKEVFQTQLQSARVLDRPNY
ncbi:MAG TPA: glycosyl hydrolase [Planctomycetaceae bacterium]|jgi:hypothetical protein|nr:glycosyl hydrolase [Planctomycetaceae bacterium]